MEIKKPDIPASRKQFIRKPSLIENLSEGQNSAPEGAQISENGPFVGVQASASGTLEVQGSENSALEDTLIVENVPLDAPKEKKGPALSPFQESMKRFWQDKRAMASVLTLVFLIVLTIVGPPIYQHIGPTVTSELGKPIGPEIYHTFYHQELTLQNQGPNAQYWLGTDALGRDLLARLMQGLLISMVVAFLVEVIDVVFGVTVGVLAGYYGGWVDTLLARFTDLIFAFPSLLFVILLSGIFGSSAGDYFSKLPVIGGLLGNGNDRLVIFSLATALFSWPMMARYVRGQTLQIKQQQYVEAARTSGTSNLRIMWKHIVPNLFSIVFIVSTLNVVGTIIGEAGLSVLGLGVISPGSSLGLMIADGMDTLELVPWNVIFPTIVLTIIVLAISFIGDGLRDAFDPRAKD